LLPHPPGRPVAKGGRPRGVVRISRKSGSTATSSAFMRELLFPASLLATSRRTGVERIPVLFHRQRRSSPGWQTSAVPRLRHLDWSWHLKSWKQCCWRRCVRDITGGNANLVLFFTRRDVSTGRAASIAISALLGSSKGERQRREWHILPGCSRQVPLDRALVQRLTIVPGMVKSGGSGLHVSIDSTKLLGVGVWLGCTIAVEIRHSTNSTAE